MKDIIIADRKVGLNQPTLIIAEVGVNHNGDIERGYELIDKAADAGVDVVKFQTYKAKNIVTKKAERYWDESLNDENSYGTQYDTFSKLDSLGLDEYKKLKKRCIERNVIFTSTPFNLPDIDILDEVGVDLFKVSSSDITYIEFIEEIAKRNKPIIISTGCASINEIKAAVDAIKKQNNNEIILQHCILQYPCDDENVNLEKMLKIKEFFSDIPVGYSDHSIGITIPQSAVSLRALTIEKHFTVDNNLPDSPDHKLSANPEQLKSLVENIRRIEKAKGVFINGHYPAELAALKLARKSLVSSCFIKKGTKIEKKMITAKRPGTGIKPTEIEYLLGKIAKVDILEDTTLNKDMF